MLIDTGPQSIEADLLSFYHTNKIDKVVLTHHHEDHTGTAQVLQKEWEVIYIPGYSDDHVALFDKETGRLFSGDLFVTPKPKVIMKTESVPIIKSSIRSLLDLDFTSMFCSHSGYIENGRTMLQEKLDHLETLTDKVTKLYERGDTAARINEKLFPEKYIIVEVSEGEWDSLHIVSSITDELKEKNAMIFNLFDRAYRTSSNKICLCPKKLYRCSNRLAF